MSLLWLGFGVVIGACSEPARGGSVIGVVSGIIAGVVVLTWFGPVLGLMGGQVWPTFLGALCGGAAGALAASLTGAADPLLVGNFGLILGGLVGATFSIFVRWLRFLVRVVALPPRTF
jgi:hypothetical protein